MADFSSLGGVKITGFISPTDTLDTYAVIDPLYGIDGLRNFSGGTSELNAISTLRRRAGMIAGISGGTKYYKLNPAPWTNTISDWTEVVFSTTSGDTFTTGSTLIGTTAYFNTNAALSAYTLDLSGLSGGTGDGNGIYSGNGVVPSGTTATLTSTLSFIDGSVGIGVMVPSKLLEVVSTGTTDPLLVSTTAATNTFVVGNNGAIGVNTVPSTSNQFRITNSNAMGQSTALRIDANKTNTSSAIGIEVNSQLARTNQSLFGILSTLSAVNTGATGINYAGYFSASNGTKNYGVVVPINQGDSGFGTIVPEATLQIGNETIGTEGTFRYIDEAVNDSINGTGNTAGYVLTTDSQGFATWAPVSGGTSTANTYTTAATLIGTTAYFDRTDILSAYTLDLSTLSGGTGVNTFSALTDTTINSPITSDFVIYSGGSWVNVDNKDIYFTASANNQTVFAVLTEIPIDITKAELFVNGVKQRYGASHDYIITGGTDVVWVSTNHDIETTDELEITYL